MLQKWGVPKILKGYPSIHGLSMSEPLARLTSTGVY